MRSDRERVEDMLMCLDKLDSRLPFDRARFDRDEELRVWCVYHISVLGEAARGTSDVLRVSHPEINWSRLIGMRNKITHGYFDIDYRIVWPVLEYDVPELRPLFQAILDDMETS